MGVLAGALISGILCGLFWQVSGCLFLGGPCPAPEIQPAGGLVEPGSEVILSCRLDNAEILYTLDGSDPADSGTARVWDGSLLITDDGELKVRAFHHGLTESPLVSARFRVDLDSPVEVMLTGEEGSDRISGPGLYRIRMDIPGGMQAVDFVMSHSGTSEASLPVLYGHGTSGNPGETTTRTLARSSFSPTGADMVSPGGLPGMPGVDNMNLSLLSGSCLPPESRTPGLAAREVGNPEDIGSTAVFHVWNSRGTQDEVPATLRALQGPVATGTGIHTGNDPESDRILQLWVADNCWREGGTTRWTVDERMLDFLVSHFLREGSDNDIFDLMTDIYGPEWGDMDTSWAIPAEGIIDIILVDLDGDDDSYMAGNPLVLGYFSGLDTLALPGSNRRICFFLDAVSLAHGGSSWTSEGWWSRQHLGVLVHEFQHMISFHRNFGETHHTRWAEECMSLCAEDLMSGFLGIQGPRGVAGDDLTPGEYRNYSGRLPLFNYQCGTSLTQWSQSLTDYSMAYAFGAWFLRNFGGVEAARALAGRNTLDPNTFCSVASERTGRPWTFQDLLTEFGLAVLQSDKGDNGFPRELQAASGGFPSSTGRNTFVLGSIDAYRYAYPWTEGILSGPWINNTEATGGMDRLSPYDALPPGSISYYRAATNTEGALEWLVWLPPEVCMAVYCRQ